MSTRRLHYDSLGSPKLNRSYPRCLVRKPLKVAVEEGTKNDSGQELERHMTLVDLIVVSFAGAVGSGIFALVGLITCCYAGPAGSISWAIGGVGCMLSGLSFAELSSTIPNEGGAYAYSYVALGELPAFLAGWLSTLEFGISGAAVARNWADKVLVFATHGGGGQHWLWLLDPGWGLSPLAGILQATCAYILLRGVQVGKTFNDVFTVLKLAVIGFMVVAGFMLFKGENLEPFAPYGGIGVMRGAAAAFFGYMGFEEVCVMAGEAKNPTRDVPLALGYSLVLMTLVHTLAALALAGMVTYTDVDPDSGFLEAFAARGWNVVGRAVALGELVTLPVTVLVALMVQPRLQFSMACDGLLPHIFSELDASGRLYKGTLISGAFCTAVAIAMPFAALDDIISAGVLVIFIFVNASVIVLRRSAPDDVSNSSTSAYQTDRNWLCQMLILALNLFCFVASVAWRFTRATVAGDLCFIVAISSTLAAVAATAGISIFCPESGYHSGMEAAFTAPLVPWLPAAAIASSWSLLVHLSASGLLWAAASSSLVVVWYFLVASRNSAAKRASWRSPGGLEGNGSSVESAHDAPNGKAKGEKQALLPARPASTSNSSPVGAKKGFFSFGPHTHSRAEMASVQI